MGTEKPDEAEPDFDWSWTENDDGWVPPDVDTSTPSVARMYDYYLGGKDNFAVDREAAEKVIAHFPDLRTVAQNNRHFLVNAVQCMAEAGVQQFIDLGTGIPTSPNVHEVAREIHPNAKIVYVDNDPIVMAHNRALRATTPGVITIQHDLRQPANVLGDPLLADILDFTEPVGVLFVAVLHFVRNDLAPGIVAQFRRNMVTGSHMAISTLCTEGMEAPAISQLESLYANTSAPLIARSRAQVEQLFEGFDMVDPHLVDVAEWRHTGTPGSVRVLAGVGARK